MDSSEDILTVADIAKAMAQIKALGQPMRRMTVSREEMEALRRRPVSDDRASGNWLFGMPVIVRSDGNYRVVLPEDRQHIAEHGAGFTSCERCFDIWWSP